MKEKQAKLPKNLCKDLGAVCIEHNGISATYKIFKDRVKLDIKERSILGRVAQGFYKNNGHDVHPMDILNIELDADIEQVITDYYFK